MIAATVAILAFGVHYKMLVGERNKLVVAEEGYKRAVSAFEAREATLQESLLTERAAALSNAAARDEARRAIDAFRTGRESDPEAVEWAAQPIPPGEQARLCTALPELKGCE